MMVELTRQEEALIRLLRSLSSSRRDEVMDFVVSVSSSVGGGQDEMVLDEDETDEDIRDSEKGWDRLFAKPEAQRIMEEMARYALAEHEAGLTIEMEFDEDGNLVFPS